MSEKILEGEQEQKLEISESRKPLTKPKLTFIEPKLTKFGELSETTTSFVFYCDPRKAQCE